MNIKTNFFFARLSVKKSASELRVVGVKKLDHLIAPRKIDKSCQNTTFYCFSPINIRRLLHVSTFDLLNAHASPYRVIQSYSNFFFQLQKTSDVQKVYK